MHIVGEVENGSQQTLSSIRITANLFNNSGGLIDTRSSYVRLDHTRPGQTNCFDILVLTPPADFAYYEFERPTFYTNNDAIPSLTIFNDSGTYSGQTYTVLGQVRNDGSARVNSVEVVSTLFDENDTVIGCAGTYVSSTDLDPGQTSSFRITNYGTHFANVARYHVVTDGDVQ